MIAYHGTTDSRAERICEVGFLPRKPSKRVWFAESRAYADRRAHQQARRSHARPVILTCKLDLGALRRRLGEKKVWHRSRIIAIDGPVPVSVLRSFPGTAGLPTTAKELAAWVNDILQLKPYRGVSPKHPGIERLSKWVTNRLISQKRSQRRTGIRQTELLEMARGQLPEFFDGVQIDPKRLKALRRIPEIKVKAEPEALPENPVEAEALALLESPAPKDRCRGLKLLGGLGEQQEELFDWCMMFLEDESADVRLAALRTMLHCEEGDAESIEPLVGADDPRIRGAAIAVLARHGGESAAHWFARGLKDPSPCVRREVVALLDRLEPTEHRRIFELALYDPNPEISRRAAKLTEHKGFPKSAWPTELTRATGRQRRGR